MTMLMNIVGAAIGCLIYFTVGAVVSKPVPDASTASVMECLPSDQGEEVRLWLEDDGHGGLKLNCEKHALLGFAMAQIPVPVSKD
jgi:hypothetical protein